MTNKIKDIQYETIVDHILNDEEFNKLSCSCHHGTTRLEHSFKVSYYSYVISKKLGLDYKAAAKAGLLHDFFLTPNDKNFKESTKSLFSHAKIAANNADEHFGISDKEKNIIETHMFPLNIKPSKFAEGWVISMVDKGVGINEFRVRFKYATVLIMIFLVNIMK